MTLPLAQLQQQFQDAVTDLWWMSETEAPIEVMVWPQAFEGGFSLDELMERMDLDSELPIQEIPLDKFFAPAIQAQDWHGDLEKEEIRRFKSLMALISSHLSDITVWRIGEIQLEIVIVGQTQTHDWIGLATQAVET